MDEAIQIGPPQRKNRRVFILVGVAVGLVLMLKVLPGLLFSDGGGGEVDQVNLPPATSGAQPVLPSGDAPVAETVATFSDKNPFSPLIAMPSEGQGDVTTTPPPEVTVIDPLTPFPGESFDPGTDPIVDDGGTVDPGTDDGASPPTTAPPRQPDRVAMLEVFTTPEGASGVSVRVNDTVHRVLVGQDFAGRYRVVSVDHGTRCAQLLFGDERFTLCEGDETLK